jgi:hypothetical protein
MKVNKDFRWSFTLNHAEFLANIHALRLHDMAQRVDGGWIIHTNSIDTVIYFEDKLKIKIEV